jgi:uncharacterized phage infection (PIP) family protein YhgE
MAPKHRNRNRSPAPGKENTKNESSATAAAPSTPSKPNKPKAWAEQGGKSSPVETRSAKKKKMMENLSELDDDIMTIRQLFQKWYGKSERQYFAEMEDREVEADKLLEEERSKWETEKEVLEANVLELREQNVGYVEQLTDLEAKYKATNATSTESGEWEKKYFAAQEALVKVEGEMEEMVEELVETKAANKELSSMLDDAKGALEEANQRAQEMEKMAAHTRAATELVSRLQEENATLTEELNETKGDLESKMEDIIKLESTVKSLETERNNALDLATDADNQANQLEQSLEVITRDLESARQELSIANSKLEGVQSPRSRSALEEEHHREVSMLQNRVSTLESPSPEENHTSLGSMTRGGLRFESPSAFRAEHDDEDSSSESSGGTVVANGFPEPPQNATEEEMNLYYWEVCYGEQAQSMIEEKQQSAAEGLRSAPPKSW